MPNNVFTTKLKSIIVPGDPKDYKSEQNYVIGINRVFLVMEYMDLDLKKLLQANDSANFNKDHLLTVFYNMLCAVNFMHTAGVMHRDLKPSNLLIDKSRFIRICDFGMARVYPDVQ
jgi:mitogen-activated protein kinase 1/3